MEIEKYNPIRIGQSVRTLESHYTSDIPYGTIGVVAGKGEYDYCYMIAFFGYGLRSFTSEFIEFIDDDYKKCVAKKTTKLKKIPVREAYKAPQVHTSRPFLAYIDTFGRMIDPDKTC